MGNTTLPLGQNPKQQGGTVRESQRSGRLPLELRLQRRHQQLVQENLQSGQSIAAGFNALPGTASAFASTQAAWRFYGNESVTLPALMQPLTEQARGAATSACDQDGLVLHDWSHLNYDRHTGKANWNPTLDSLLRMAKVLEVNLGDILKKAIHNADKTGGKEDNRAGNEKKTFNLNQKNAADFRQPRCDLTLRSD